MLSTCSQEASSPASHPRDKISLTHRFRASCVAVHTSTRSGYIVPFAVNSPSGLGRMQAMSCLEPHELTVHAAAGVLHL